MDDGLVDIVNGRSERIYRLLVLDSSHEVTRQHGRTLPGETLALVGIDQQARDRQEHCDGRGVVIATRDVGREATGDDAGSRSEHENAGNERDHPQNRVDDFGPGKRQQPDEEHGNRADHAVEDNLVQQRRITDDLGRRLGLGTNGINMRGDDDLLATARITGDVVRDVFRHNVLRNAIRAHLGENGIAVVLGEVDEEASDHEDEADDEHGKRDAGDEDTDAGDDRAQGSCRIRKDEGPAYARRRRELVDAHVKTVIGQLLGDIERSLVLLLRANRSRADLVGKYVHIFHEISHVALLQLLHLR